MADINEILGRQINSVKELKKAIDTCTIYRDDFIAEWHKRFD